MKNDIEAFRNKIDRIDDELLRMLIERAELCLKIGEQKKHTTMNVFDPDRESSILKRLVSQIESPLNESFVNDLFSLIFSYSRSLQQKRRIAYLGPEGSYSHLAAYSAFRYDACLMPFSGIEDVIGEVRAGRADLGVVPVENSTEGMVHLTLDTMITSKLYVCKEIMLPIRNSLLSRVTPEKITNVFSHPQALAQCRNWLRENLPGVETIETKSTSQACIAARNHKSAAAIASSHAAHLYGLPIVEQNINDAQDNITRFWILSRNAVLAKNRAKTSIIITLENVPGALFNAIGVFASQGINLTKIESRPSRKGQWEYVFFIDFQGSLDDEPVRQVMLDLVDLTKDIIVLGSYPEGEMLK
ncbi:MAG: prephenate dehydratase [Deltaproteobacteria bacterium]|nr:prephenate dehydratase [Deltaproteobacteria bacterium]